MFAVPPPRLGLARFARSLKLRVDAARQPGREHPLTTAQPQPRDPSGPSSHSTRIQALALLLVGQWRARFARPNQPTKAVDCGSSEQHKYDRELGTCTGLLRFGFTLATQSHQRPSVPEQRDRAANTTAPARVTSRAARVGHPYRAASTGFTLVTQSHQRPSAPEQRDRAANTTTPARVTSRAPMRSALDGPGEACSPRR